jgi:hypothetical protein
MDKLNYLREFREAKEVTPLYEEYEDVTGETRKSLFIKGPFLEGDVENRNGRVYPVPMLTTSVDKFKQERMARGIGCPGELNHPESSITVDLERVSHYIVDLNMDGNQGIGKAKISSTPTGKIAEALITDGMILGVSTRGVGRLGDQNGKKVVSDFELVTVDIVYEPSAPNAFVEKIMEGLQYYKDDATSDIRLATTIEELLESMKCGLSELPKKQERRDDKIFNIINETLDRLV